VRHAGDQLTDRRHFLRLYELFLQPAPVGLVLEHEDRGARLGHGDSGEEQHALAGANLRRAPRRLGDGARHGVRPGGGQEAEPGPAGDRGDRDLDQVGEHAVGAAHGAMCVHDADRLGDGVDRLLPLALGGGEELHQARVLERDRGLREHGGDERQLGLTQHAGPLAREDTAPIVRPAAMRGAPSRSRRRVHRRAGRPAPAGLFAYLLGERERPAPQRELEQGVVGARRNGVRVVGHRQAVRLGVK